MKAKLLFTLSFMLMAANVVAENTETISVKFSDFPKGSSYAENEKHNLGSGLVIYTTQCHFTSELRIYSSTTYNGYVVSDPLPGVIKSMSFTMGYKEDVLNVYGSTDKENWTLIKEIETTSTSYKNYTLIFPTEKEYTCFKLDVKGENQIRIESMSVTYIKSDESNDNDSSEGDSEGDNEIDNKEEIITISAPIFNPISTSFSTEFLEVTMDAAEGCEIYYTIDGTTPSYTNAKEYNGTKGNSVIIYASDNKVTLQAIAVDPITEKCSGVSSATYTYKESSVVNDGGSKAKAYTVAEVKAMLLDKGGQWVRGTIYGTMVNDDIKDVTTTNFKSSNIVIGDEVIHIPVQLPQGSIREEINLVDHPYLKGKEILIKGDLESYCNSRGIKSPTAYEISYSIPINHYGYATLYLDMPVLVPVGSTAYYCVTDGTRANLYPVGNVIPAGVGVIISSAPNKICTLTYTTQNNSNAESILANNDLVGFVQDSIIVENDYAYYALNVKDNKIGFYVPQTTSGVGFIAKANKAYLRVPVEFQAAMFVIHNAADETAVVPLKQAVDNVIYDLQGRIVSSPSSGIYIVGGKKIVIK